MMCILMKEGDCCKKKQKDLIKEKHINKRSFQPQQIRHCKFYYDLELRRLTHGNK
jgi:hypothetical protein